MLARSFTTTKPGDSPLMRPEPPELGGGGDSVPECV